MVSLSRGEEAADGHDEGCKEESWSEVLAEEKDGEQRAHQYRYKQKRRNPPKVSAAVKRCE